MRALVSSIWFSATILILCTKGSVISGGPQSSTARDAEQPTRNATTWRLLRVTKTRDEDVEERGLINREQVLRDLLTKWRMEEKPDEVKGRAVQISNQYQTSQENAVQVFKRLLDSHVKDEAPALAAFNLLKLPHNEEAFGKHEFIAWIDYVEARASGDPNDVVQTFVSVFGGEKELAEIISVGVRSEDQHAKATATEAESYLLKKWASEEVDPKDLVKRLEMDQIPHNDLSRLPVEVLLKYVDQYTTKNPTSTFSLTGWLTRHYDGIDLSKALVPVGGDNKEIARLFQKDWHRHWKAEEASEKDVFPIFIHEDEYNAFTIPSLKSLKQYITVRKGEHERHGKPSIAILCDGNCNRDLAILLAEPVFHSKNKASLEEKAVCWKLMEQLFKRWEGGKIHPIDIKQRFFEQDVEHDSALVDPIISAYEHHYTMSPKRSGSSLKSFRSFKLTSTAD